MKSATFDIETNGLFPEVNKVHCVVVKDHQTKERFSFGPDRIQEAINLLSTYEALVGHNCIDYDFPVLRKVYGWEYAGRKIDTLLISRLQRPNRRSPPNAPAGTVPHSVAAWGWRVGRGKVVHDDWGEYSPEMLHRCEEDCEIQYLTYLALLKEGEGEGWENAHKLTAKLFHHLQRQQEYGWTVDAVHIERCFRTLNRWISRIDNCIGPRLPLVREVKETKKEGLYGFVSKPFKKDGSYSSAAVSYFDNQVDVVSGPFSRVGFRRVNLDKSAEVKDFLLKLGWEPTEWNTNNVGERTSPKLSKNDKFEGVEGGLGKLLVKRVQCKQRKGIIEGWRHLVRGDGRIGPTYSGLTTTGRLRHSGIVNVPSEEGGTFFGKWMRAIFTARPGWVMVGCDSKGNQLRQLASHLQDDAFTKTVLFGTKEEGTDLHAFNQKLIERTRTEAKNFFYGLLFGAGDAKIGKVIKKGPAEGKALKEYYFGRFPSFKVLITTLQQQWRSSANLEYDERAKRKVLKNGYITGLDGRPILVESEHMVLVYLLQSDEAIQMAAAYCWFHQQMERRGYVYGRDWGMLIWYHDEYQLECRPEISEDIAKLAKESIAWAGRFYHIRCPHEGDAKIGNNWAETH